MFNKFSVLVLGLLLVTKCAGAGEFYADLHEVICRCEKKPGCTYEQSCGAWIDRYKSQVNECKQLQSGKATPLHRAIVLDRSDAVEALLLRGADVNARRGSLAPTALDLAVSLDRLEAIRVLNRYGVDVNAQNSEGMTPLHWAVYFIKDRVAMILLQCGAKLNITEKAGRSPLQFAKEIKLAESEAFAKAALLLGNSAIDDVIQLLERAEKPESEKAN